MRWGTVNMLNFSQGKLKKMETGTIMNTIHDKLNGSLQRIATLLQEQVFSPETRKEKLNHLDVRVAGKNMMNTMHEKLSESLLYLQRIAGYVPPPETRKEMKFNHMIHVAKPFIIPGLVVVLVCLWCCCHCCRGGNPVKMMKAPGRNIRIARPAFETNPKLYFRNLHKKKKPF